MSKTISPVGDRWRVRTREVDVAILQWIAARIPGMVLKRTEIRGHKTKICEK
ncbi:hypothetical protein D3OALGB2SA_3262 [Olavius algarvensis associated proteobacterium Delta 3]|nr:hypothetical protein D3OALGB2SA_3262 [Olavius algarvensis associated proteobacterium Delta 3]